jgi:hypothetical protein
VTGYETPKLGGRSVSEFRSLSLNSSEFLNGGFILGEKLGYLLHSFLVPSNAARADDELFSQATSATTSYMSIAAGLSATKTGFELIKGIRDLLKGQKVDAGEISARMLELQELMLDARTALTEAQDENVKLEARNADLTRMALFGKDFKSAHGVYWYQDFPYCPICWDVDRKPVRLAGPVPNERYHMWTCPFHKPPYALHWNAKAPAV